MASDSLPTVWVVRADGGRYTQACVDGGYTGIGWNETGDLSRFKDRDAFLAAFREQLPDMGRNASGNIARFRYDIRAGDYVITPAADSKWLRYGLIADAPYYYTEADDGCRFGHRRKVSWARQPLNRAEFSVPLQQTLNGWLTVYRVRQREEFLAHIGLDVAIPAARTDAAVPAHDPYMAVLDQILELSPSEFEELVRSLLSALGFEDTEVVGKAGDRGVDVKGTLNASGLARVDVYVQAKRYQVGGKVGVGDVLKLRQVIPTGGQGAVITTADFHRKAHEAAGEPGFPRVGLINGSQLVDLLAEHWQDLSEEFRELLGLKPGLVLA